MEIQKESDVLKKLINEMHDVTGTWSVDQMVTHVWQAAKASVAEGFVLVDEDVQKQFEKFAKSKGWSTHKWSNDNAYSLKPVQTAWEVWQAAKADVVPKVISDIQSWIAVNSFSALDVVQENIPIIDANEMAVYVDSLNLNNSVPDGFDYKQLYKLAIINSKRDKAKPNWAHVVSLGVGSGKAKEILRSFNIDPEATEMRKNIVAQEPSHD